MWPFRNRESDAFFMSVYGMGEESVTSTERQSLSRRVAALSLPVAGFILAAALLILIVCHAGSSKDHSDIKDARADCARLLPTPMVTRHSKTQEK